MTDQTLTAAADARLYSGAIVVVLAVVLALLVWGGIAEWLRIRRGEPITPQPLNAPAIKPRCQAAHCSNAAMPEPVPHVDGTDMLVCPGCRDTGCREGWIVQEVAS